MTTRNPTNLLFIFSDQHTRRALGAMHNSMVKTPHLDRLAAGGTLFTSAYCNAPICVPSRASLATGRYAFDIESWDNSSPYLGNPKSWAHRLRESGQTATSIGKLHYRRDEDPTGFEPQINAMQVKNDGIGNLFLLCRDPLPVAPGFKNLITDAGPGESSYIRYDEAITEQAVQWIQNESQNQDKPWTLFVGLVCPHPPWIAPEEWYNQYPLDEIVLPDAYNLDKRPMHPAIEDIRHFLGIKERFGEQDLRKVIASYYALVSYLDDNIGKILSALEEAGLNDSTRILYTCDHGESMGQKGLFGKTTMYEESVGVPMILSGPDIPSGKRVDTPVQLVDVYPTVLESAGVPLTDEEKGFPGTSLFDIVDGEKPDRPVFAEMHSAGSRSATFMIRHGKYKYVHFVEGYTPQLFDLEKDPHELNDLGSDPNYTSIVGELKAALYDILDPEQIDKQAKASQADKLEKGGGAKSIMEKGMTGFSPTPMDK